MKLPPTPTVLRHSGYATARALANRTDYLVVSVESAREMKNVLGTGFKSFICIHSCILFLDFSNSGIIFSLFLQSRLINFHWLYLFFSIRDFHHILVYFSQFLVGAVVMIHCGTHARAES